MKAMKLIAARLVKDKQQVMLFTHNGMAVRFDETNVRPMGRTARGVRGVTLKRLKIILSAAKLSMAMKRFWSFVKMALESALKSKSSVRPPRWCRCALDHHKRTQWQCRRSSMRQRHRWHRDDDLIWPDRAHYDARCARDGSIHSRCQAWSTSKKKKITSLLCKK